LKFGKHKNIFIQISDTPASFVFYYSTRNPWAPGSVRSITNFGCRPPGVSESWQQPKRKRARDPLPQNCDIGSRALGLGIPFRMPLEAYAIQLLFLL